MRERQFAKAAFDKVVQKSNGVRVGQIQIAIGEISELDQNLIQQHWFELSRNTSLEHACLRFRLITAEAQCMMCFKKYHPVNGAIHCPHCGNFSAKILSGEEFYVEHIEMDTE